MLAKKIILREININSCENLLNGFFLPVLKVIMVLYGENAKINNKFILLKKTEK